MIIVITTIIIITFSYFLYHRISNALKLPNMLSPYKNQNCAKCEVPECSVKVRELCGRLGAR